MKTMAKKLSVLILITGFIAFGACREIRKKDNDQSNIKKQHVKKYASDINTELLIGSWLDTSESALHFSLLKDRTARSDNMATLLYKKWRLEGTKLILTVKSIGNGTSSMGEEIYEIQTLTEEKMILQNGEYLFEFVKKK